MIFLENRLVSRNKVYAELYEMQNCTKYRFVQVTAWVIGTHSYSYVV